MFPGAGAREMPSTHPGHWREPALDPAREKQFL